MNDRRKAAFWNLRSGRLGWRKGRRKPCWKSSGTRRGTSRGGFPRVGTGFPRCPHHMRYATSGTLFDCATLLSVQYLKALRYSRYVIWMHHAASGTSGAMLPLVCHLTAACYFQFVNSLRHAASGTSFDCAMLLPVRHLNASRRFRYIIWRHATSSMSFDCAKPLLTCHLTAACYFQFISLRHAASGCHLNGPRRFRYMFWMRYATSRISIDCHFTSGKSFDCVLLLPVCLLATSGMSIDCATLLLACHLATPRCFR